MHNCEVIAIANQKGGVGKTTTAFNLGVALANQGKNVLLIDSDPQGDLTVSMGFKENEDFKYKLSDLLNCYLKKIDVSVDNFIITHKEGVDLIPSNLDLSAMEMNIYNSMNRERIFSRCLKNLRNRYDYILIDCQPSLSMLTINALAFADKVVIPVQSQYLAAKNTSQLLEIIGGIKEELNEDLTIGGILITVLIMVGLVRQIKPVRFQHGAASYVVDNSFRLNYSKDIYLYRTVTRTAIPKSNKK